MSKNKLLGYSVLGIAFILVSVIVFVLPTDKTGTFWIAYGFTAIAFAAQIVVWGAAFKGASLKSKFLGVPLVHIGLVYLVVQLIALAVFITYPYAPTWSVVVVCALILSVAVLCMISSEVGRGEIQRVDEKIANRTSFIKRLQTEIELLADTEADPETKQALIQLAEKVRYSDPVSSDKLTGLENEILSILNGLHTSHDRATDIEQVTRLLNERSMKGKTLK